MNNEDILRAMGMIDPEMIDEAAPDRPRKHRSPWLKWAVAAAACLVAALCAIPVVRLISGGMTNSDQDERVTVNGHEEGVSPRDQATYSFDDYQELRQALKSGQLRKDAEEYGYGARYEALLDGFRNGEIALLIPHCHGEPCPLEGHAEWQKITLFTSEYFTLPWIWYYCDFDGKPIVVSVSYTDVLDPSLTEGCATFAELAARLAPDYAKPTKTETVTFMGKPVEAAVYTVKDGRTYYRFLWDDMMVSVWGYDEITVPDNDFWASFSLEAIK